MLKSLFSRPKPVEKRKKVVIVSGLPRSGTSMMMKMLAEGGLPIVTDSQREADEDNPNGYFEVEVSKKLKDGEINWIYDAQGKTVKVISYLLEFLPSDLEYDIVFMDRERSTKCLLLKRKCLRAAMRPPVFPMKRWMRNFVLTSKP